MTTELASVDVDAIVAPIRPDSPAGADVRRSATYEGIKAARKSVDDKIAELVGAAREEAREVQKHSPADARRLTSLSRLATVAFGIKEWNKVQTLTVTALKTQSKDLQIAMWLLEANAQTDGLGGVASGLSIVRRLVEQYWETLFPALDVDDDDPAERRIGILEWATAELPSVIKVIPLTDAATNYTLLHHQMAQARGDALRERAEEGWPPAAAVQKALDALPSARRDTLIEHVTVCLAETAALDAVCDKEDKKIAGRLSFAPLTEILEQCGRTLRSSIKSAEVKPPPDGKPPITPPPPGGKDGDIVAQAIELVRQNRIEGLRLGQDNLASARTGRQRFLRQLELAELCLEAGMHTLAFPLLDELGHTVEENNIIADWEDPDLFARMWSSLARAGEALKAIKPAAGERGQHAAGRLEALRSPAPSASDAPGEG